MVGMSPSTPYLRLKASRSSGVRIRHTSRKRPVSFSLNPATFSPVQMLLRITGSNTFAS